MPPESEYLDLIYEVVRDFNGQLPPDQRLVSAPETVLIGDGGVLDSLGLINFLVLAEDALTERLGQRVTLLDEKLMGAEGGPFETIGSLARYVSSRIDG